MILASLVLALPIVPAVASHQKIDANGKCTEYRPRYEQAIRYGLFKRPSLVNNEQQAYSLYRKARQGN